MAIISLQETVDFLGVPISGSFEITAVNDVMVLTSSEGGPVNVELDDGTYEPAELATELQTQMNADNTLTGTGTITFAVSYSTTTYKFTIDATAGNTIAYTDTGSDAGVTLGFDADHSAAQTITSNNAVTGGAPDIIDTLREAVIAWVESYCYRTFESTTYTNELYDGTGGQYLYLRNYPTTVVSRIATGREAAIEVKNTDTDATNATVSVDDDGVNLVLTGGSNPGTSTVDFATYATMTAVVNQIIAIGNGWTAQLFDSDFGSIVSTELLEMFDSYCGSRANTVAEWLELPMPSEPLSDFRLNSSNGELYRRQGWWSGFENVVITHTSGYSAVLMPDDLKTSLLLAVQALYSRKSEAGFAIEEFEQGNYRIKYGKYIPDSVFSTWDLYQRVQL